MEDPAGGSSIAVLVKTFYRVNSMLFSPLRRSVEIANELTTFANGSLEQTKRIIMIIENSDILNIYFDLDE